jgi:cation/acetate symporter
LFGEVRLGTVAVAAFAIVLVSLGLVEALDRYGAWPVLPALFPIVPLAIAAVVAIRLRSLDFGDIMRGGKLGSATIGWAVVGTALSTIVLVAAPVGTALGGGRGLLLIGAFVAGLAIATFVVAPSARKMPAATLAEALGARFGSPVRAIAAVAVVLTLLPLLTAEAALAGTIAARMLGLPPQLAADILLGLAALGCVVGGLRAAIAMAMVLGPIVALAYLVPVTAVSIGETLLPMPWIGLLEPEVRTAAARIPNFVVTAFTISLVAGVAAMPTLAFPAWQISARPAIRRHLLLGVAGTAAILLAAPSYAVYGRLAGIDATTDPLGLIVSFPTRVGLSAMPAVLLIGGLVSASLVTLAMGLATIATTVGQDLYGGVVERRAPTGRRIFITRLSILLAVAAILGLSRLAIGSIAMLAGVALSVAAASLAPLLLVGWRMRRASVRAAVAAIAVGLWLTVANVLLARFAPDFAGRFLGMGTVTPTVLGPTGWFGLPVGLSGPIGLACGLATLLGLSLLPGQPWPLIWLRIRHVARRVKRRLAPKPKPAPATVAPVPAVLDAPLEPPMAGTASASPPADDPPALFGPLPAFEARNPNLKPAPPSVPPIGTEADKSDKVTAGSAATET